MDANEQKRALGDFVRAHRERLAPGMPSGRRRTPGLRREELAGRAGISPTWCAWIEQGRDVQVSPHALGRLARALLLTRAERAYLFELAGRRDPEGEARLAAEDTPASLQDTVEAIAFPAYGLDRFWNACCWNPAAAKLFPGWLGEGGQRNLLRFIFLHGEARRLLPDWEERARRVLAEFRADYSRGFNDRRMTALVEELRSESRFFADCWEEQAVLDREGGVRVFTHPAEGTLRFRQHTFSPAERPDFKLVVLRPSQETAG